MKQIRFIAVILAGFFCGSVLSGCVVLGAGLAAGYIGYEKGALVAAIDEPVDVVYEATLEALKGMGADVVGQILKRHESKVQFYSDYDEKKSTIEAVALTEYSCKLVIRVGLFGNDIAAQKILEKIKEKL